MIIFKIQINCDDIIFNFISTIEQWYIILNSIKAQTESLVMSHKSLLIVRKQ